MKVSSENLISLDKGQIKTAAQMLAGVFVNEPVYKYFIPDEVQRNNELHYHFILRLHYAFRCGEVYTTSSDMEGIAMWFPPGYTRLTFWILLRCGGFSLRLRLGKESVSRQMFINDYLNSVHSRVVPFPHWYLSSLGVKPDYQRKGYAGTLMHPILARIDAEKSQCYLETQKESNIPIYQHYGFKVVEESIIPGTEIRNWALLRHNLI